MSDVSNNTDIGYLQIKVTDENGRPIENATADISYLGDEENILEEVATDSDGKTPEVTLRTPPLEWSESPGILQPYSEFSIVIRAGGYAPIAINGMDVFSGQLSFQPVNLRLTPQGSIISIGPHTLNGDYPSKIPESEIKPMTDRGEIVLDKVVVPEIIVVHDGVPSDSTAADYYVFFSDYIKNVASCEIYPTWPEETLRANIIAIISFTLNRVYTEWYRNKGYYFTITSSTAYDHKWINGRNYFDSISYVVDDVFKNYVSSPNVKQPLLTQYCDGVRTTCSGMSQWGSKYLGDENYSAIEILRNYYGDDVYINTADEVEGIPMSWPGSPLDIGSYGPAVRTIQEQLDSIRATYSNIPYATVDGIYGEQTAAAVRRFQNIFNLPETGVVDYRTWYRISQLYVALERLANF